MLCPDSGFIFYHSSVVVAPHGRSVENESGSARGKRPVSGKQSDTMFLHRALFLKDLKMALELLAGL